LPVARIAEVSFTSDDRVRDAIHNFNTDGFDSLCPKYKDGWPKTFTLPEHREINEDCQVQADRARPAVLDLESDQAGGLPGR
jgi:transposase